MGRCKIDFLIGKGDRLFQVKVKRYFALHTSAAVYRVYISPLATTMATSISPVTSTYTPLLQPGIRHNITTTLRRSMTLLAPNARGSLKRASQVKIIAAEDSGIGHSVAVLYAADGSGVAVVRLPRG